MSSTRRLAVPKLLHEAIEYQAASAAGRIAVEVAGRALSYGELAQAMADLAAALQGAGVARHDRVIVLAENGIEACQAVYGILRVGACFVAVNPAFPPQRVALIVRQTEAAAIVTTRDLIPVLADALASAGGFCPKGLIVLDATAEQAKQALAGAAALFATVLGSDDIAAAGPPAPCRAIDEDLAYVLFTSGTTGVPKGVMVSHRAVREVIEWGVDYFAMGPDDRLSNHFRLSFDASLFDIFCAAFAGATVLPLTRAGDCAFPGEFIRKNRVTLWFSVPSVIDLMMQSRQLTAGPFPHLRAALFGGEPLTPAMVAAWRQHQPHVPLYNLYGPTEAAIACTVHHVGVDSPVEADKPVPIGRETRCAEMAVLKSNCDELAEPGEIGRLTVCGTQLADGYWRRPDLTAQAFRLNPLKPETGSRMYDTGDLGWRDAAGSIHFAGRADAQVKIMGFRVELGEIEATLNGHHSIWESVVVLRQADDAEIVGMVIVKEGVAFHEDAVLDHCAAALPAYMVPARVLRVEALPRNINGKADRKAAAQMIADGLT